MRLTWLPLAALLIAIAAAPAHVALAAGSLAPARAEFKLGFKTLADLVPAAVGDPVEDEHWGSNGDSLQRTTNGLMVWRKADNWTAFTDGSRTWINGPFGIQSRANAERFPWEGGAVVGQSDQSDITLWDRRGTAAAYIAVADDRTIYLWSGEPVAYLVGDNIYGFNGVHLGWFQDGIVWDWEAVAVGFSREAPLTAQRSEPPKAVRQDKPVRLPAEPAPVQPTKTLGVFSELLTMMLRQGRSAS